MTSAGWQTIGRELSDAPTQFRKKVRRKFISDISRVHVFILTIIHIALPKNVVVTETIHATYIRSEFWEILHREVAVGQNRR